MYIYTQTKISDQVENETVCHWLMLYRAMKWICGHMTSTITTVTSWLDKSWLFENIKDNAHCVILINKYTSNIHLLLVFDIDEALKNFGLCKMNKR